MNLSKQSCEIPLNSLPQTVQESSAVLQQLPALSTQKKSLLSPLNPLFTNKFLIYENKTQLGETIDPKTRPFFLIITNKINLKKKQSALPEERIALCLLKSG